MLDFVVVSTGYITIITQKYAAASGAGVAGAEFEVLRTLRVLRAVKTISILPGNAHYLLFQQVCQIVRNI